MRLLMSSIIKWIDYSKLGINMKKEVTKKVVKKMIKKSDKKEDMKDMKQDKKMMGNELLKAKMKKKDCKY